MVSKSLITKGTRQASSSIAALILATAPGARRMPLVSGWECGSSMLISVSRLAASAGSGRKPR